MKVSLNTIKQYTDVDLSVDKLVASINAQLGSVDEIIDLKKRYEGATIVKVVECSDHPNADKLHVCKVDDSGAVKNVERDENGYVQIVCGAPNVHTDMFAVWLPPKSTVPSSFDDKEPFVLDARELRGVVSNGMLASAKELGIGDSHDGIVEIDPTEWKPNDVEIKPGVSFAKVYGLDDTIIDIENKMFTHRPDLFGQLGVAREIAGIQHKPFTSPDWYKKLPKFDDGEGLELEVGNEAGEKVPRFMAVAVKNVTIKPSPLWLQCELVRLGSKPINNVVDVTNYIMLLTAQPLHAYDYDKLRGHKLGARMAVDGEKLPLLNGKTYELSEDDVVIIDGEGPVGLGGIMGGGNSEVSPETTNIVLECANFDMYTVRKTSMRHGVFTDALTRFNKGQSPLQNPYVLSLALQSIFDTAGGEQASGVFDVGAKPTKSEAITTDEDFINERLGLKLMSAEIIELLENVEVSVELPTEQSSYFKITPPFWRTDLELGEDIVEEVGRLYGFDKLPRELPSRSTKPAPKNKQRVVAQSVRERLASAGANEVLTYSFVHEEVMKKAGQDVNEAFKLSNALSPDLQYYRLSILPSLLSKVHGNIRSGFDEFALFEIGRVHAKSEVDEDGLPREFARVGFVYAAKEQKSTPYYIARRYAIKLINNAELVRLDSVNVSDHKLAEQMFAPFIPVRSAAIIKDERIVGVIGEFKDSVQKAFKLPVAAAGFELFMSALPDDSRSSYEPLSRYPSSERDICFQVKDEVSYEQIRTSASDSMANETVRVEVSPVDIYKSVDSTDKNITIRLRLTSPDKTLTADEIEQLETKVISAVAKETAATVV